MILESKDYLCGIDEAGRGCIAGSLFVACVILQQQYKKDFMQLGIKDSKQLSFNERNAISKQIYSFLQANNGFCQIVCIESTQIDTKGLSWCIKYALSKLFTFAKQHNCKEILFDGNTNFGNKAIKTIIKGDSKEILIGAASILAKTKKDEEMISFNSLYPNYDFKNNKGYLTKKHKEALQQYGYSPIHRKSYHIKSLEATLF